MQIKNTAVCRFQGYRHSRDWEEYMRETEAAAYLRVSTATLRRWRRKGRINKQGTPPPKSYGHGRQIWYRRSDLDAWIAAGLIKHFWLQSSGRVHQRCRR